MHRIVFVVAVLALAAPALAGDGRGEIHQACVATGCFAGDSPRFPVEITAPGSYLLTSNLSVPDAATAGISIGVADVSLDLAGFALQGPVVCSGEPVTSCAPSGNGFGIAATRDSRERARHAWVSKLGWIRDQQARLRAQARETPRQFVERESHYLWGRRHLLSVTEEETKPSVRLSHHRIMLTVRPGSSRAKREEVIHEWHKSLLHYAVSELIRRWEPKLWRWLATSSKV